MHIWRQYSKQNPLGRNILILVFLETTPQNAQLLVEPYICDILNQIYRFFLFFNKKLWKEILDWTARVFRSAYGRRVGRLPPTKHEILDGDSPWSLMKSECAAEQQVPSTASKVHLLPWRHCVQQSQPADWKRKGNSFRNFLENLLEHNRLIFFFTFMSILCW